MNAYMLLYIFHIQLGFWNNNFKKWKPYKTIVEHLRCEGFTIRYNNSYALNSILEWTILLQFENIEANFTHTTPV